MYYVYVHMYIDIWVSFITTEPCSPEPWESLVRLREIMPKIMAELFRLVNYSYPDSMEMSHDFIIEHERI